MWLEFLVGFGETDLNPKSCATCQTRQIWEALYENVLEWGLEFRQQSQEGGHAGQKDWLAKVWKAWIHLGLGLPLSLRSWESSQAGWAVWHSHFSPPGMQGKEPLIHHPEVWMCWGLDRASRGVPLTCAGLGGA